MPNDAHASLSRFYPRFIQHMRHAMAGTETSLARAKVLMHLRTEGAGSMVDIARALAVTKHNVTQLVDALEADGSVRRRPHPTDRRVTLVEITDAGRDRIAAAGKANRAALETALAPLDAAERVVLARLLDKLCDGLPDQPLDKA